MKCSLLFFTCVSQLTSQYRLLSHFLKPWCRDCEPPCFGWPYVFAFLSVAVGLILDTVTRGRREMKLLAYLSQRGLGKCQNTGTHLVSGSSSCKLAITTACIR